jgi:hypothetical protein
MCAADICPGLAGGEQFPARRHGRRIIALLLSPGQRRQADVALPAVGRLQMDKEFPIVLTVAAIQISG